MSTETRQRSTHIAQDTLVIAAERSRRYIQSIANRRVAPAGKDVTALSQFHEPFPERSTDAAEVIAILDDIGSPATVATTGHRYFGYVIGGNLPASMAASWLATAWDQNVALRVMSPVA